ncbi:hypothetical protein BOTBODRAFT_26943 [Botryobasidium botryosum FD-172 SS1]|uniref:Uncharacterized protein n=1 Tax=Botryobasidium botryosum (strain FD-172 SS1) TaxID=930990 RepID=A0A067N9Z1_BOTB1|nr:hypothetical protein BOTBODRAFT_26943 [Botryobasidium botryosum FD-172 SS1]
MWCSFLHLSTRLCRSSWHLTLNRHMRTLAITYAFPVLASLALARPSALVKTPRFYYFLRHHTFK